ncbi:MAG: ParB/RepB/Spo0J family partition protein [Lachnospiraceae bacterium]|nr:ParB/RepB/Spo0J family partition protein [Lachnospiraceae bacterium]
MEKADIIENTAAGSAKENREALDSVVMMKISQVEPNRNQPRKEFDKEKLEELAESIRQYGVIQPLLVQKNDGYYEIIAGERRWRASQMAGIREVPVIIRDYTEQEVVEISLIENIQREDLNPIEEANAYVRLMDEFHMTQENIAQRVSKSRAAVTNAIRLLRLPDEIREMLIYGELTEGHARALLSIPDAEAQIKAAKTIVQNGASVRETEKLVKEILNPTVRKKRERDLQSDLIFRDLEEQMKKVLGTKVSIRRKNKSAGKIEIDYYSAAELERLLDLIRSITS